jgi:hypothetical protein
MIEYDPLTRRVPAPCLVTSEISQSCRSRSVANHQVIAMRLRERICPLSHSLLASRGDARSGSAAATDARA